MACVATFAAAALVGMVHEAIPKLSSFEQSSSFDQREGVVFARDGRTVLRRLRSETSRRYVHEQDVPAVLADAVMAAEDRRFEEHGGIDPVGIVRAAVADIRHRRIEQGGSTITQQLVKNAWAGSDRTATRKSREALLSLALETRWSKRRILTAYLNTAYFGAGAYGISNASRIWFGTRPNRLTLAQSALLAGMLRAPELDNPIASPELARRRRATVIDAMVADGNAPEREAAIAKRQPLPDVEDVQARIRGAGDELAPHFVDAVAGQLVSRYGAAATLGNGLRVTTTLDARLQLAAVKATRRVDGTGLSTAIVAIDPRSWEVRALAIGGPARSRAFNIALDGRRQPGSAFKPFTLVAALRAGYTHDSRILSAPFSELVDGERWTVTNDEQAPRGMSTIERATWRSDNTVYARLGLRVGIPNVVRAAHDAGISSPIDENAAMILGGLRDGVTPLEMAQAYGTLAAHGRHPVTDDAGPRLIRRVVSPGAGTLLDRRRSQVRTVQGIERAIADLTTRVLEGVITSGTGVRAGIGRPAAGKTGTTENNADAWFVGYVPENLVVAVWVGHPAGSIPMPSEYRGGPVFGGTLPAEEWHDVMSVAVGGRPAREFNLESVHLVPTWIDPVSRLLTDSSCAGAVRERFLDGLQPGQESSECISQRRRPATGDQPPAPGDEPAKRRDR